MGIIVDTSMAEICHCAKQIAAQNRAMNIRSMAPLNLFAAAMLLTNFNSVHAQDAVSRDRGGLKSIEQVIADAQAGIEFITGAELKKRIAANPKLVLLDVRTEKEFAAGHLKGAAWVERGIAEFVLVRQLSDPNTEIVVYCKVGNRTGLTVKALKEAGYRNVVGLQGGFDEWAKQGNTIHNYLGEFQLVKPMPRNSASLAVDFYENKQ
jgi:rhodanese-related sulfurtransferase